VTSAAPARRFLSGAAAGVLLAGPTALAFFSGGYFPEARAGAGIGAWALVAVGALVARSRSAQAADRVGAAAIGRRLPACLAIGGLAGLAAWTMLSMLWAPIVGSAYGAGQIAVLYLGALIAATLLLTGGTAQRRVEPVLAAGILIVIGYGVSARLVPGVLNFARSVSADGRLEQPLTYWNAMGELAAIGVVLCARLAGDERRSRVLRTLAAAAATPVGLGLYLSFSRGALFAAFAGLVTVTVAAPHWSQLRATALVVLAGAVASGVAAPSGGVTNLQGSLSVRESQGTITLVALFVIMAVAAGIQDRLSRREGGLRALSIPRWTPWAAAVLVCAGMSLAIALGAKERSGVPISSGANRLVSLQSNRYAYWKVALKAFAHAPIIGVGAAGWSVWWLRYRPYPDGAQNAHSLELETLAELGLIGLAMLAAWLAGIGLGALRAHRIDRLAAAGPMAVFATWLVHTPLDWDWQMPAVTLVAMIAAGALLAQSSDLRDVNGPVTAPRRPAGPRG
jgi:hypothetical protein